MVIASARRPLASYRTLAQIFKFVCYRSRSLRVAKLSSSIGQILALALEPDLDNITQTPKFIKEQTEKDNDKKADHEPEKEKRQFLNEQIKKYCVLMSFREILSLADPEME